MTRTPTTTRRPTALLAAFALAAIAALALAGPASAHHHGRHHHRHHHRSFHGQGDAAAGQVTAFNQSTGRLTIALADGDTVSGRVGEDTWIDCGHGCHHHHGWWHHGRRFHRFHRFAHGGWTDPGCSTADLVPGAMVEDALLAIVDGHAVFLKVELKIPSSHSSGA